MEAYVRAHSEKDKNTSQTPKLPYHLKKSTYINDKNDKTNPQPSTVAPPSITYTAAPTPAQKEVKQKINTENNVLQAYIGNETFDKSHKVAGRRLHQERQR